MSIARETERTFFSLRYAIPGYAFIAEVVLTNLTDWQSVRGFLSPLKLNSELLGILVGFGTLLSGAEIGFLVSQLWYLFFEALREKVFKQPFEALRCKGIKR